MGAGSSQKPNQRNACDHDEVLMQLNRGLAKNAMCCDSMWGQDLGGLNASREAFDEIAEPAPEPTKLRHSEFPENFSPPILVGAGGAARPLLTPVPTGERVW